MRTIVAMVLILCGTVLAMAPIASDYLQARQISQALAEPSAMSGTEFIRQPLEESYRLGSWILGGAMIGLGIIGGCRPRLAIERCSDEGFRTFAQTTDCVTPWD